MKKIISVIVILFLVSILGACSGDSAAIKGEIESNFKIIQEKGKDNSLNKDVIMKFVNQGLDGTDKFGIDTNSFISALIDSCDITTSVNVKDDEAIASLKIKVLDLEPFIELLNSKGNEFKSSDERKDFEKEERYARAKIDFEETLAASDGLVEKDISIEYKKNNDAWVTKDGRNIVDLIVDSILSKEEAAEISRILGDYTWKYDDMNASQILEAMKADGLAIGEIQAFDEVTDPNGKLGRPGYYTSKADFLDTRVDCGEWCHYDGKILTDNGGTMEVFSSTKDAKSRENYLDYVTTETGFGKMYMYRFGNALFRVGMDLLPSQAKEYEDNFFE